MMKVKDITSMKAALEVLRGCSDVIIDEKSKTQYFTVGMHITPKIAKAGAVIDSLLTENGNKREWSTVWMHKANCACKGCFIDHNTHTVASVRHAHPRKRPVNG